MRYQQRLTVGIWRDIGTKWFEILEAVPGLNEKNVPLFAAEGEGFVTLIWGEGLTSDGKWFRPVEEFAKNPSLLKPTGAR